MDLIEISEKLDALVGFQIIETISLNLLSGIIGADFMFKKSDQFSSFRIRMALRIESNKLISLIRAHDLIFLILIMIRMRHGNDNAMGGDKRVQSFALTVARDLHGIYWSRIDFNGYNMDRIKCSIAFPSFSWLSLNCHFIH